MFSTSLYFIISATFFLTFYKHFVTFFRTLASLFVTFFRAFGALSVTFFLKYKNRTNAKR